MKISLALLALAVTLPAAAQNRAAEIDFQNASDSVAAAASVKATAAREKALRSALTAMNDGVEAGGSVTRLLEDQKIAVEFATQPEPATTVTAGGKTAIKLSDALPAHPRVYAALIAAEAAKRMFADMPACAERSYMRGATAARAFAELGGDFKTLPVVDGDKVEAVKTAVAAWTYDAQTALHEAGAADGVPLLAELPVPADQMKALVQLNADKRFIDFLMDEREARADAVRR